MSSPRAAEVDEPELELSLEQVAATLHTGTRSPRSTSPVSQSTKQAALIVLAWAEAVQEYNNVAPNVAGYWHLLTAVRCLASAHVGIYACLPLSLDTCFPLLLIGLSRAVAGARAADTKRTYRLVQRSKGDSLQRSAKSATKARIMRHTRQPR